MILNVSDDFCQFFEFLWLQINQLVGKGVVLKVPQINAEVVCRQKGVSIWARAEWVDVVVVTVLELFTLNAFVARADDFAFREYYFIAVDSARIILFVVPIL